MKWYNIPIFIPHEGCPHDCVFCNQRKITGLQTSVKPEAVEAFLKEYLAYLQKEERRIEVAFFGGSFTGLPLAMQEQFYRAAAKFSKDISGIRLSTRPDYINQEVLELAKAWGVTMIELGAQSSSDAVLWENHRGHQFVQTKDAVKMIREYGIGVGLQMMTGMAGSNREIDLQTAQDLAALYPDCVRIYPTLVLKDTLLEKRYMAGAYLPQTMEEAIETAKEILLLFRKKEIPVIRLGLHAGEELQETGNVVAGPFHPAFGELVESRIWRDCLEQELLQKKTISNPWVVSVPAREVSKAVGHKRCNSLYFKERYGITLCVVPDTKEVR